MTLKWPNKDPNEVLDYSIDWSARLAGDTIATVTWLDSAPAGLTRGSTRLDGTITTAFFSGGDEGITYAVTCRITTAGGRTMDETAKLLIKTR